MAQLSQLLLFDPDPSGLDTLTFGFEKGGYSVTGTSDAAKARDLVHSANPSLLIVNLRDAEQSGLELLRTTTSNPRTRNLPAVAIGRDEFRSAALAAGAFIFLSVPLFVRDVIGVCRMVIAAAVPGSRPSPEAELSLQLHDLDGVYFLVRTLAVTRRSAVVEARHGPLRGELRFIDGSLTSADLGAVQGLPALHQMLLWDDAALHFKFKNVVRRGAQLSLKSSDVLEECDRFLRDFAHEARDLGVARSIYLADLRHVQPSPALPGEVIPILKLFDGRRDLAQILDASPFRVFDTLKIIKRFVADGAIRPKITTSTPLVAPEGAPLSGAGALDFWLQKQAPPLGTELGAKRVHNGIPSASPSGMTRAGHGSVARTRPSSPFVPLGDIVVGTGAGRDALNEGAVARLRARTITRKNVVDPPSIFPDDMITPPPVEKLPPAQPQGQPSAPSHARLSLQSRSRPPSQPPLQTQPRPDLHDEELPQPQMLSNDPPAKPASAVARGEIKISLTPPLGIESAPLEAVPSVMVEKAALSTTPPPTPAQSSPPMAEAAPPSVIVAPMTPAPVIVAPEAMAAAPPTEPKRHGRSPSDSFNAMEADFFEREADLYKRESIESFDDLESHGKPRGT